MCSPSTAGPTPTRWPDAQLVDVNEDGSILITLSGQRCRWRPADLRPVQQPGPWHSVRLRPGDPPGHLHADADYWGPTASSSRSTTASWAPRTATVSLQRGCRSTMRPRRPGQAGQPDRRHPVHIVLPATDKETAAQRLVFTLVDAAAHGALAQGANGSWTYTAGCRLLRRRQLHLHGHRSRWQRCRSGQCADVGALEPSR